MTENEEQLVLIRQELALAKLTYVQMLFTWMNIILILGLILGLGVLYVLWDNSHTNRRNGERLDRMIEQQDNK